MWHGAQVYLAAIEPNAEARQITSPPGDTYPVSWSFDSRYLLVTKSHDGDEREALHCIDIETGEERALTSRPDDHFLFGGELHPNGRWLVYGATKDFDTGLPVESAWIWRHDLETDERVCLARPIGSNRTAPQISPDGVELLYVRNDLDAGGRQLWLVGIDGTDDREIANVGAAVRLSGEWSPDGRRIVVHADGPGYSRVGIWSRDDSTIRWLIDDPHRNVEIARWPHRSDRIVCVETVDAISHGFLLDPRSAAETPLVGDSGGTVLAISPARDGRWLGHHYDARHADRLVLLDPERESSALIPVAALPENLNIDPAELAMPESVSWQSTDGAAVQGWLYRPSGRPLGVIVAVHGGPTWHIENRLSVLVQYLVRRGFIVLEPNYRGSTGFGPAWREAIKADGWGGREQDDIRSGIRMLIESGVGRPGCIGITGVSYGGYSSWCAITRWPVSEIAAAVPVCGMTDLVVDYETTRPDLRAYSVEMMGGTPDELPELYHERSPIHFVDRIQGRLTIVQGMQDPNVTPENLAIVRRALDDASIEYELLTFDDEGHGIAKAGNRRVLYSRLADFFERAFARSLVAG
jgi:dipeptidyl aminopeptidase/acylaminoacyl peptidase